MPHSRKAIRGNLGERERKEREAKMSNRIFGERVIVYMEEERLMRKDFKNFP